MKKRKIVVSRSFRKIFLISSIIFLFVACNTEKFDPDTSGWGYEYFPLERNSYRIYDVTIIDYSIQGKIDTIRYLLKEVVSDSFLTLKSEVAYVLSRFKKGMPDAEWKIDSMWTAKKDHEKVVVTENNVPFIKMVFPVKESKQWDGNKMNIRGEEKYKMGSIGSELRLGETVFSKTLTILQQDNPDTILIRDKRWETYGLNIGLIYKEKIQVKYCSDLTCIGEGKIESGTKYKQVLREYGKE